MVKWYKWSKVQGSSYGFEEVRSSIPGDNKSKKEIFSTSDIINSHQENLNFLGFP
jgi:hypothetical protein